MPNLDELLLHLEDQNAEGLKFIQEGDYNLAVITLSRAYKRIGEIPDGRPEKDAVAIALAGNLGNAYGRLGDWERGLPLLQQQRSLAQKVGDRIALGNALNSLAIYHIEVAEDLSTAEALLSERIEIARSMNDRKAEGNGLNNLGRIYLEKGNQTKAIKVWKERLKIAQSIQDFSGEASSLTNLGSAMIAEGKRGDAKTFFQKALAIYEQAGHPKAIQLRELIRDLDRDQ